MSNSWTKKLLLILVILVILLFKFCSENKIITKKGEQDVYFQNFPKEKSKDGDVTESDGPKYNSNKENEDLSDLYMDIDESSVVPMPVFYQNRQVSEIEVFYFNKTFFLKKSDVFSLKKVIKTDLFSDDRFETKSLLSEQYIKSNNSELILNDFFKLKVDYDLLSITLIKTADTFEKSDVSFKDLRKNIFLDYFKENEFVKESKFTFVNDILFRQTFDYNKANLIVYGQEIYPSYFTSVNSYLNLYKLIFESSFSYSSSSGILDKNYFRAKTTIEPTGSTIAIGDLSFRDSENDSLSGLPKIYGIGVYNNEALNQVRTGTTTIDGEFKVKERSKVEILNKETTIYSAIYSPGEYKIRDLPIDLGENDLKIKITSQLTGQVETISVFDGFTSSSLIKKGKIDYRLGFGGIKDSDRSDPENRLIFGSIEGRVSDYNSVFFGYKTIPEKVSLIDIGTNMDFPFARSYISASKDFGDGGFSFQAAISPKFKNKNYNFDLNYTYFSDDYIDISETGRESRLKSKISVRKSFSLDKKTRLSFSSTYGLFNDSKQFSFNSSLFKKLSRTTSVSFSSGLLHRDGVNNFNLSLSAVFSLDPDTKASGSIYQSGFIGGMSSSSKNSTLSGSYQKDFQTEAEFASIDYQKKLESFDFDIENKTNLNQSSNSLSVGLGTSLILTDSAFSINRPIYGNSFVLIKPSDYDFTFASGSFNQNITKTIVYPVSSYTKGKILVSPELSDESFSLKDDYFSYYVSEKSSATVNLQVKKVVVLSGKLLSENKVPLSLYEGRVKINDNTIELMTDEFGDFTLEVPDMTTVPDQEIQVEFFLLPYPDKNVKKSFHVNGKEVVLGEILFPVFIKPVSQ